LKDKNTPDQGLNKNKQTQVQAEIDTHNNDSQICINSSAIKYHTTALDTKRRGIIRLFNTHNDNKNNPHRQNHRTVAVG